MEEQAQSLDLKMEPESSDYETARTALSASAARAGESAVASDDEDELDSLPVRFVATDDTTLSENYEASEQASSGIGEGLEKAPSRNCERLIEKLSSGNSERLEKSLSRNSKRLEKKALSGNGERLEEASSGDGERLEKALSGNSNRLEEASSGSGGTLLDQAKPGSRTTTTEQAKPGSGKASEQASSSGENCEAPEQSPVCRDSRTLFQCGVCTEKYKDPSQLAQHIRARHGVSERSVRCGECLKVFKFVSHLREHAVVHTGEKPFKCEECSSQFGQASNLRAHVKTIHRLERPYKCEACPAAFPSQPALVGHSQIHTEARPYRCDLCPSAFPNPKYLHKHKKKTHRGEHPYNKSDLRATEVKSAENLSPVAVGDVDERPYTCDRCDVSFRRPAHLTVHKGSHTRVKPTTECEICQKVFSTPQSLEKHKKLHLTDQIAKVFRCGEADCFEHFKHVTGLNQHKVIAHGFAFINGAYRKASITSSSKGAHK